MNNQEEKPECYNPEKGNPYPLCIGNGSSMCEECGLYADFKGPYDGDIWVVTLK